MNVKLVLPVFTIGGGIGIGAYALYLKKQRRPVVYRTILILKTYFHDFRTEQTAVKKYRKIQRNRTFLSLEFTCFAQNRDR